MKSKRSNIIKHWITIVAALSSLWILATVDVTKPQVSTLAIEGASPQSVASLLRAGPAQVPTQPPGTNDCSLKGEEAVIDLKQRGLYSSLADAFKQARCTVNWVDGTSLPDLHAAYFADNPAQQMGAYFTPAAVHLTADPRSAEAWAVEIKLVSCGYGDQLAPLLPGTLSVAGNHVENRREVTGLPGARVTEWYVNKSEGLEQGFTISRRLGSPSSAWLRLALEFDGGMIASMGESGRSIALSRKDGKHVLRYGGLSAWDATGSELEARMSSADGRVWIEVNDSNAVYPVTIDPTFTQQQQLAPESGAGDNFGFSVSLSGDTAVIGAPNHSVRSHLYQGSALVFVRSGTTWSEQQKLIASDGNDFDQFGTSVAISGDSIVVGAIGADVGSSMDQGSAYVFVRNGTVWTEQQKLSASDGDAFNNFGQSVAISGDSVAVGAPNSNVGPDTAHGSVYVFFRSATTWSEQQKLVASDGTESSGLGFSVAISGDRIVAGAPYSAVGANEAQGAAYVFLRSGSNWSQQQKLLASDGSALDFFGYSVAISVNSIVVGAPADDFFFADQGSAYVYVQTGTIWVQQQQLTAFDPAEGDFFGQSVSMSGSTIVVGAPDADFGSNSDQGAAYVFVRPGASWFVQRKLSGSGANGGANDLFGFSVAISGDTIAVGAPNHANGFTFGQGSVSTFVRSGAVWPRQQQFTESDVGSSGGEFGISVAISGDTAVIGSYTDDIASAIAHGSAYVFVREGTGWIEQQKLIATSSTRIAGFGYSVAIDGDTIVAGSRADWTSLVPNQGAAYVFVRNGTIWSQQQKLLASDGRSSDDFGFSVGISGDTVVVGAPQHQVGAFANQGAAYVFVRSGTTWSEQQKLASSTNASALLFGRSVAISGDTMAVGANLDLSQGSVSMFLRSGNTWSQQQKLTASDGAVFDDFGGWVAMSGDTMVVGAALDDVGSNSNQGSAYVFVFNGVTWMQQQKLVASDGNAEDFFGISAAITGDTLLVGAFARDIGSNSDQGSVYVFVRTGAAWSEQQKLTSTDGAAGDSFGFAVAISGETVVVGAPFSHFNRGSAYVFALSSTATVPTGSNTTVQAGPATVTFSTVSAPGTVAVTPIDPTTAGQLPSGYRISDNLAFEITTTANVTGPITVCLHLPSVTDPGVFSTLRILHGENGVLVDRTILPPDSPAPDFATRTICARVDSLSPFVVARLTNRPPLAICKSTTVSAGSSCTATVSPSDVNDGSFDPDSGDAITLVLDSTGPFAQGSHEVTLTATDTHGASSSCTATVTVVDTTPPTITCPASIVVTAPLGQSSTPVNYPTPTAVDNCSLSAVACSPPSGSSFPLGTTTVACSATDPSNNAASCSFTVTVSPPQLTALGSANVWLGLRNSDDVGVKFDLLAEALKNGAPVGSGELDNFPGGSSGFNNAVLRTINLALSAPVNIAPGDTLSFRLSVRIATASSHRSGTARLWFNDAAADSHFDATIGGTTRSYYLTNGLLLSPMLGPGPKNTSDVSVDRAVGGNPFKPFGTWSVTF